MKTITFNENEWQLVPKKATREMVAASWGLAGTERIENQNCLISVAYHAMLAAAPAHPEQPANEIAALALEEVETAWAQTHRLALELECFLLSCKDMPTVSRWWDSANEALDQYRLAAEKRKEQS